MNPPLNPPLNCGKETFAKYLDSASHWPRNSGTRYLALLESPPKITKTTSLVKEDEIAKQILEIIRICHPTTITDVAKQIPFSRERVDRLISGLVCEGKLVRHRHPTNRQVYLYSIP